MSRDCNTGGSRRDVLFGAIAGVVTLAPGITLTTFGAAQAKPAGEPVSSKIRWGLLVDVGKCKPDCDACIKACAQENGLTTTSRPEIDAQWIRKVTLRDRQSGVTRTTVAMCQHCENPPCVDVCPTGASFRREDGIVLVDKHICIGCRYCMMACPFKARSFVHEDHDDQTTAAPRGKGVVESCNFCVTRVDAGKKPACVEACAGKGGGALTFGDLNDPDSDLSRALKTLPTAQLRSYLELNQGVRYANLK
jgi:molybdopterin-containing oxidoreductase family iron-sulfur binding subunit